MSSDFSGVKMSGVFVVCVALCCVVWKLGLWSECIMFTVTVTVWNVTPWVRN